MIGTRFVVSSWTEGRPSSKLSPLCYGHSHGYPSWLSHCDLWLCKYGPPALSTTSISWLVSIPSKIRFLHPKSGKQRPKCPNSSWEGLPATSSSPKVLRWLPLRALLMSKRRKGVCDVDVSVTKDVRLLVRTEGQKSTITPVQPPSRHATNQMVLRSSSTS